MKFDQQSKGEETLRRAESKPEILSQVNLTMASQMVKEV